MKGGNTKWWMALYYKVLWGIVHLREPLKTPASLPASRPRSEAWTYWMISKNSNPSHTKRVELTENVQGLYCPCCFASKCGFDVCRIGRNTPQDLLRPLNFGWNKSYVRASWDGSGGLDYRTNTTDIRIDSPNHKEGRRCMLWPQQTMRVRLHMSYWGQIYWFYAFGIIRNQNVKLHVVTALIHWNIIILSVTIHIKIPFAMKNKGMRKIFTKFKWFDAFSRTLNTDKAMEIVQGNQWLKIRLLVGLDNCMTFKIAQVALPILSAFHYISPIT